MSYADAAAKGPKQSSQQARAPNPPHVEETSSSSSHVTVESADRINAMSSNAQSQANAAANRAQQTSSEASSAAKDRAHEARSWSSEKASEAEKDFQKAKVRAKDEAKRAEKEIKREYNEVYENRDNPVVIANGVAIVATVIGLAYGGYQKHQKGELNWQVTGTAAAIVGLLGVGDYYLSQYLFKNKYPKK